MNEPLEAKKAPDANGGEGEALTPQASQLEAYKSTDYPLWPEWQLRWREIVNSGGTLLCSPVKIRGTRLEAWAMDRQSITNLSTITSIRDTKFPKMTLDWGICGIHVARVLKGSIALCSCPKQTAYARTVLEILRRERQYAPHVWAMMLRELEALDGENHHRERLLKTFYAIDPAKLPAWMNAIVAGNEVCR
ncbi:MAG: hypothetical protein NTX27_18200 [Verrucomicrobia bacterium]|nr:hypothetical protein [Verrucomicrobiota bacterium]